MNINDVVVFNNSNKSKSEPIRITNNTNKNTNIQVTKIKSKKKKVKKQTDFLSKYFKFKSKIKKDDYIVYNGKKTILGSLIKNNDTVVEVLLINGDDIEGGTRFISVTVTYVALRETGETEDKYVSLDDSRRIPLLIDKKYINSVEYDMSEVYNQFL